MQLDVPGIKQRKHVRRSVPHVLLHTNPRQGSSAADTPRFRSAHRTVGLRGKQISCLDSRYLAFCCINALLLLEKNRTVTVVCRAPSACRQRHGDLAAHRTSANVVASDRLIVLAERARPAVRPGPEFLKKGRDSWGPLPCRHASCTSSTGPRDLQS